MSNIIVWYKKMTKNKMCVDKQYTIKKHHIMQNVYSFKKNASLKLI